MVAANINKGEQLFLEYKPNTLPVVYKPGSTLPVLYKNPNLLPIPVANNSIFTYTPLLITGGVNKVQNNMLLYKPVATLSVKYPNLTDSENKFLNDNKYEYNATTNPGPLSIGDNPQINNFYGGMFVRMGDKTYPYGSWYTKVPKNSEVQARIDLAIKKWWVKPNGEIKIRGLEADKSILDTIYYIKFPKRIPKYKGPVG